MLEAEAPFVIMVGHPMNMQSLTGVFQADDLRMNFVWQHFMSRNGEAFSLNGIFLDEKRL